MPNSLTVTIDTRIIAASQCNGNLRDADSLIRGMRAAVRLAGATEYGTASAEYLPHGVTAIVFLAESHVLVSTWPEARFAHVEISVCGDSVSTLRLWEELRCLLMPGREELRDVSISS